MRKEKHYTNFWRELGGNIRLQLDVRIRSSKKKGILGRIDLADKDTDTAKIEELSLRRIPSSMWPQSMWFIDVIKHLKSVGSNLFMLDDEDVLT